MEKKSKHPSALKNGVAYSQTSICSTEYGQPRNCTVMKQKLLERKYNEDNFNKQIEKVDLLFRKSFRKIMKTLTTRKTYR